MQSLKVSYSSSQSVVLWLGSLAGCLITCSTSAAPVVVSIDAAAYAAEFARLQKEIVAFVREAEAKEKEAATNNDVASASGAAESYAKAAGRSAQQYFMSRSMGRAGATEEVLVRRYVRQSYALKPDRSSYLNPELTLAHKNAVKWMNERGVVADLAADLTQLERAIEVLPEMVFIPEVKLIRCAPSAKEVPCPIIIPPKNEGDRPKHKIEPEPKPSPPPNWQRLGIELAQMMGASIHRGREGYIFTHRVFGARLGLSGRVWEGVRSAFIIGGVYSFRSHRIGIPPITGDGSDLPSLVIYEHSITAGPRLRLSPPRNRVAVLVSASLGVSLFNPLVRSPSGSLFSDHQYTGPKPYGEGMISLLIARDIITIGAFVAGSHFDADARKALGTSVAQSLTVGGTVGVDLIQIVWLNQHSRIKARARANQSTMTQ